MAGQLIRRGDRKWLLRIFTGRDALGKRGFINKTVHGTRKEADAILQAMQVNRSTGLSNPVLVGSVNAYLDTWLATTVASSVRLRTAKDYEYTLSHYVRPHVGSMLLQQLGPVEVRQLLTKLRSQGLERSVRKVHEVLRNAMEQAVADGLILTNPAKGRNITKALPKKVVVHRQVVSGTAVPSFLTAIATDPLRAYWLLLLTGGLRPSEALALQWNDLQDDTVSIHRTLTDHFVLPLAFSAPKTDRSRRAVVLPAITITAMMEHKRLQGAARREAGNAWKHQDLIFPDETGRPLRQERTRHLFTALLKRNGLPHMRIYDLRHSAATLLLEMGEDLKVVSERLGHSTIVLTGDTYAHVTRGMQERAASKLHQLFG